MSEKYDFETFDAIRQEYEDVFFVAYDRGDDGLYSKITPLNVKNFGENHTSRHVKIPIPRMISEDEEYEFVYYGIKRDGVG